MYKNFIKRILDIVLSGIGIIVLCIPMIIFSIIIKTEDRGSAIFKQKRVGKNKKYFNIYKFRSMKMSTPKDCPTHLLKNPDEYILKCGKWMRKYSIDELPQLFNIFKGDMSIVGPRPALWNQYDLIEERDKYNANNVRPGLTGLAQIEGRDELEIIEKAKLDGEYVKNLSFMLDMKCFFRTFLSVAKHEGVVEGGTGSLKKESDDNNE